MDCNPEATFSIPGFAIEEFIITGSRGGIKEFAFPLNLCRKSAIFIAPALPMLFGHVKLLEQYQQSVFVY